MKEKLSFLIWKFRTRKLRNPLRGINILNIQDTIKEVIDKKLSISRFGDGELLLLLGVRSIVFQDVNENLKYRLQEVITSDLDNHLVCLNGALKNQNGFKENSKAHWISFLNDYSGLLSNFLDAKNKVYGNALMSRFYNHLVDKSSVPKTVELLKKIWEGRKLLIVEGTFSRLGIGNDFFSNSLDIKRILCPPENAFSVYNQILNQTIQYAEDRLIIIALGPTATVLAYDLAQNGFQALDLGHIDIEYSWYLNKATGREAVRGKKGGEVNENIDLTLTAAELLEYESSIVSKINVHEA